MKKIFRKEFVIGLCVIIAGLILIFGIDYLKGINLFTPANYYYAEYDNVSGLAQSSPVSIDGFKVGQVREIQFNYDKPGKIRVLLALNKELHIPADSKATIASTLMSGSYIDIHLGSDKKMLPVGGTIPSETIPDMMTKLQADILPSVNNILPRIDSILYNLNRLVADPALAQSINRFDGITENVMAASVGLNNTLNRQLPGIIHNANGVVTDIDSVCADLQILSAQLRTLPINETFGNVNQVVSNLEVFSKSLNDPNSTLSKLTRDPELYNRINTVAADIDSLIVDIKKNPKRYINIKVF